MSMDKYIVSEREFIISAAIADIREVYGFEMNPDILEREDAILTAQELIHNGYAAAEGNRFVLLGDYRVVFENIKNAKSIMEVHKRSGQRSIYYLGEGVSAISFSQVRKDSYEVSLIPCRLFLDYLQEEGWIPELKENRL